MIAFNARLKPNQALRRPLSLKSKVTGRHLALNGISGSHETLHILRVLSLTSLPAANAGFALHPSHLVHAQPRLPLVTAPSLSAQHGDYHMKL